MSDRLRALCIYDAGVVIAVTVIFARRDFK